jgi:predicted amidohydrolase
MEDVRVALHQLQPALGEPRTNLRTLEKKVRASRADLCVFPELYLTGYFNRDLLRTLAEPLDGPLGKALAALAKRTGKHVITGMPRVGERRGVVHNSSVLAAPDGQLHAYDKVYLPTFSVFEEDLYFGEGHELPVFRTDLGNLGMCICYDLFFPEVTKALAMQGAELLTCISASPTISRAYFEKVLPARAIETTSFLLFTNLVGPQDQVSFWGGARVFGPRGDLQAEGPVMKAAVTTATLDLAEVPVARAQRPALRDTRPELLGLAERATRDAMPGPLRVLEALHGRLDPWAVAGLRAGMAARHALRRDGHAPGGLAADVRCPAHAAAFLDGLQVGSGCTLGRSNLRVAEGPDAEASFRAGGRTVRVLLRTGQAKRLEAAASERELADRALDVYAMPEAELLEVR